MVVVEQGGAVVEGAEEQCFYTPLAPSNYIRRWDDKLCVLLDMIGISEGDGPDRGD